jgi:hypothetical protein
VAPGRGPAEQDALRRAKSRLDRLALYDRPVDTRRVRILAVPWLFKLPWFRRFTGYALPATILLRRPLEQVSDDLICHELCHVWQLQRRPVAVPVAFLRHGYRRNPFELEARHAAAVTRERTEGSGGRAVGSGAEGP